MELTSRQKEVFNFVKAFIRERGFPPSVREIGQEFHIYPRAVFDHLKALEKKGYLKRRGSMSRGLEVLVFQENGLYKMHPGHESRAPSREVPILGRVTAGTPVLAVEHVEGTLSLPAEWTNSGEVFLLRVSGDSMSPYILSGDYVIVRSQSSAENGDVVVTLMGEEVTVKRFFKEGGMIELKPDNERRETIKIEEGSGDFKVIGKVIGVYRKI